MMMNCDMLFMIGTNFPYAEWLPEEGKCKCVEIDIDPATSPTAIRWTCRWSATQDTLRHSSRDSSTSRIVRGGRTSKRSAAVERAILADRAQLNGNPMIRERVMHELSPRLPDRCILMPTPAPPPTGGRATSGCARAWTLPCPATWPPWAPVYPMPSPHGSPSRSSRDRRGRRGAFQMNGMNEMITIKRYQDRLMKSGAPFVSAYSTTRT